MMVLVGVVSFVAFAANAWKNVTDARSEIDVALIKATSDDFDASIPHLGPHGGGQNGPREKNVATYSVTVLTDGSYYENSGSTAYMSDDDASVAIQIALASGKESGKISEYSVFYRVTEGAVGTNVAFTDSSAYDQRVLAIAGASLGVWLLLMAAILVITLFLARYVTKPVERAWNEQQRFIADASHELKTPLTVILADASILLSNPEKTIEEQRQWVEGIDAEASNMQHLTEDMLTLAQGDLRAAEQVLGDHVDFSQIVESEVLQFDAVAFERGLFINDDIEEGVEVTGDAAKLERLVKTLLENACKYSSPQGSIDVGLSSNKDTCVLTVHNTGDPIPEEDLPHLFERFYRSDKARTREGESASFGLGLSIAKSTVELHHGTIGVTSGEGGTVFTVTLPKSK